MLLFYIFVFLACCFFLYLSGEWVVGGLVRITRFLGWKEFVVAFFVMAIAASLPNLFVGITSALRGIPQLSFGDVGGNNIAALTLAVALAVLFAKDKNISTESRIVQTTSMFTVLIAVLPLILILDGKLSRADGLLLILFFFFYNIWLFSKKERFTRIYDRDEKEKTPITKKIGLLVGDFGKVSFGIIFLIGAAQGIVSSAAFFAQFFNLPIILIGLLITGLGNALPEIYFAVISAKKGETPMILGNLMGSVIIPSTLVLGVVALICPIEISNFSPFAIARIFLVFSALFFFFFVKSERKITKREAMILLGIYILFVVAEILRN